MKKFFYLSLASLSLFALPAKAVCPVCIVAVGAGLGLSEYLGIDDTIAGVWIGGMMVAMTIWTINWLNTKKWKLGNKVVRDIIITVAYYAMLIWPLISRGLIGQPWNKLFGIDKLALGIVIGSLGFLAATTWYEDIKKKNNGHAQFPFQKVAWPVGALVILSLCFYLIVR